MKVLVTGAGGQVGQALLAFRSSGRRVARCSTHARARYRDAGRPCAAASAH